MVTILIIVAVLAGTAVVYFGTKSGKIADANNNNIPDVVEEKVEEVKAVVKEVKAKAKKVKAVADAAVKKPKATTKAKKTTK